MSDYTSCAIEFTINKEFADLIKNEYGCFCEGWITEHGTAIVHYNGNRYDHTSEWNDLLSKAWELEEENKGFSYHSFVYSTEYAIEENGLLDGCAYVGISVDDAEAFHTFDFNAFILAMEKRF